MPGCEKGRSTDQPPRCGLLIVGGGGRREGRKGVGRKMDSDNGISSRGRYLGAGLDAPRVIKPDAAVGKLENSLE